MHANRARQHSIVSTSRVSSLKYEGLHLEERDGAVMTTYGCTMEVLTQIAIDGAQPHLLSKQSPVLPPARITMRA
jgi:hypothetical protein